jgi:hypothetical protein
MLLIAISSRKKTTTGIAYFFIMVPLLCYGEDLSDKNQKPTIPNPLFLLDIL